MPQPHHISAFLLALSALVGCGGDLQAGAPTTTDPGTTFPGTDHTTPPPECLDPADCDDGNPCTGNACVAGTCTATALVGACDDGDPCTVADACQAGTCVAGAPMDCEDGIACTTDYCWDAGCKHSASKEPECALEIHVLSPQRGGTVVGSSTVAVSGVVDAPAGPVTSLEINGQDVPVGADGAFDFVVDAQPGINLIQAEAHDAFQRSDRVVQAFAYTPEVHPVGSPEAPTLLGGGIEIWLDDLFFDDDDRTDLDDVSTLAAQMLAGFDLAAALPHPLFPAGQEPGIAFCTWNVDLMEIDQQVSALSIRPVDGGISLEVAFTDVVAWLEADSNNCPDAAAILTVDSLVLDGSAQVTLGVGGAITVSPGSFSVDVIDLDVELLDQAAVLNGIVDWLEDEIAVILAAKIEEQVPEMVLPLVQGILDDLSSYQKTVDVPALVPGQTPFPLTFQVAPESLLLSDAGMLISLGAGTAAPKGTSHSAPGSMTFTACGGSGGAPAGGGGGLQKTSPIEASVSEDILNQLLFSVWWSGGAALTLEEMQVSAAGDGVSLSDMTMEFDSMLPPVVTTCTEHGGLELQLGDVRVDASFMKGTVPAGFALYTTTRVVLEVGLQPGAGGVQELAIQALDVESFAYEIVGTEGLGTVGPVLIEGLMPDLIQQVLVPEILAKLNMVKPIPAVDVSPWLPAIPSGTELTLDPDEVSWEDGQLIVRGTVLQP